MSGRRHASRFQAEILYPILYLVTHPEHEEVCKSGLSREAISIAKAALYS
jgi:hypothetical protein